MASDQDLDLSIHESDMMEEEVDGLMQRLLDVVAEEKTWQETVRLATTIAFVVFLVLSLILNLYIIINICCKKRIQVCYFSVFLVGCLLHLAYFASTSLALLWATSSPFVSLLPALPKAVLVSLPATSRATVGAIFLTVAALTVERFLSSTVRLTCVRATLSFLALLVAIAGPALLLAFQILAAEQEDASLTTELWFGVEVAVYIICPLLVLTVFGTVNYCKVSLTSRLLPSHQVQAVKLNIGVTVTANLAIFLFLVQECLGLWLSQLEARSDPESVAEVRSLVEVAHNLAQAGVGAALSLLPLLYLCLTANCCRPCCCPAINQLEEGEVSYTMVATEERR